MQVLGSRCWHGPELSPGVRGSPLGHRCACDLHLKEAEVTEDPHRAFAHIYSGSAVAVAERIASVIKALAHDLVVHAQKEDSRTL